MYRKTYYATHPGSVEGASNEGLRDRYHIPELYAEGELRLNYLHYERFVIGGAAPSGSPLSSRRRERVMRTGKLSPDLLQ